MTTLAIGVDLGGTNLRIAAVDGTGNVLEKITTSTQVARGRDQVIDEMCTAIQEIVGKQKSAGELAGIGIGVGGGVVMRGQIWHGMTGMAGELGHINVEPDGHPCKCGSRGCLEQYASATAIKRMAQEAIAEGNAPHMASAQKEDVEFNS